MRDKFGRFTKGHKLINGGSKGKHWKLSKETKKKMSKSKKGIIFSKEHKQKLSGKNHYLWKGNEVGYSALHMWIRKQLGKANHCEECDLEKIPKGKKRFFQWANISKKYKRILEDWKQLCIPCHKQFDKLFN